MNSVLKPITISGKEVLPIIEGGKGVSVTNGKSCGSFAACGAVGTFSGTIPRTVLEDGRETRTDLKKKTRRERYDECIQQSINASVTQARLAREVSDNSGRVHMNMLWEAGGTQIILDEVLQRASGLIDGVTCGAGMPYNLGAIASKYKVFYYPIVSSARAFNILWRRSYKNYQEYLGGVVYEDPWKAGGHNGLSNRESPDLPLDPIPRLLELRKLMDGYELYGVPIIMAGGLWYLRDFLELVENQCVGPIAFQFGTRPILTKESPVPLSWKRKLMTVKEGDVLLHNFSPTGFYSSALRNGFIKELEGRSRRQVSFSRKSTEELNSEIRIGPRKRVVYVNEKDLSLIERWESMGYTETMVTPDSTLIFVTPRKAEEILEDQINCKGCLSACRFSNWSEDPKKSFNTGFKPDPRSFCISKTLINVMDEGDVDNELVFSGHYAFKFQEDPLFSRFKESLNPDDIPSCKELIEAITSGN